MTGFMERLRARRQEREADAAEQRAAAKRRIREKRRSAKRAVKKSDSEANA